MTLDVLKMGLISLFGCCSAQARTTDGKGQLCSCLTLLEAPARGATEGDIPPAPAEGLLPDFSADQIGEVPGRASEPEHMEPILLSLPVVKFTF